jgi:hypothetical protein
MPPTGRHANEAVVTQDRPGPPVELGAVAGTWEPRRPRRAPKSLMAQTYLNVVGSMNVEMSERGTSTLANRRTPSSSDTFRTSGGS